MEAEEPPEQVLKSVAAILTRASRVEGEEVVAQLSQASGARFMRAARCLTLPPRLALMLLRYLALTLLGVVDDAVLDRKDPQVADRDDRSWRRSGSWGVTRASSRMTRRCTLMPAGPCPSSAVRTLRAITYFDSPAYFCTSAAGMPARVRSVWSGRL